MHGRHGQRADRQRQDGSIPDANHRHGHARWAQGPRAGAGLPHEFCARADAGAVPADRRRGAAADLPLGYPGGLHQRWGRNHAAAQGARRGGRDRDLHSGTSAGLPGSWGHQRGGGQALGLGRGRPHAGHGDGAPDPLHHQGFRHAQVWPRSRRPPDHDVLGDFPIGSAGAGLGVLGRQLHVDLHRPRWLHRLQRGAALCGLLPCRGRGREV
mmetsp:Transcript_72801/g.236492  ORF Transcript_72801/g.236492 Transcript_72801/m.236492 type:complete len:212 (+) Transcript_72801:956-1591(+)